MPVRLYADLPYSVLYGWPAWVTGEVQDPRLDVDAFWGEDARHGAEVVRLDAAAAAAKLGAMRKYRSEFSVLDRGPLGQLSNPAIHGYEVFWWRPVTCVLVISDLYPPVAFGGYERTCAALVEGLGERHEVTVLTSDLRRGEVAPQPGVRRELAYLGPRRREAARVPLAAVRAAAATRRALADVRPDLVYVWNCLGISQAAPAAGEPRAPVVYRLSELWFASSLYRCDRFVGCSGSAAPPCRGPGSCARSTAIPPCGSIRRASAPAAISWCSDDLRRRVTLPAASGRCSSARSTRASTARAPFRAARRAGRRSPTSGASRPPRARSWRSGRSPRCGRRTAFDADLVLAGPCEPAMARRIGRWPRRSGRGRRSSCAGPLEPRRARAAAAARPRRGRPDARARGVRPRLRRGRARARARRGVAGRRHPRGPARRRARAAVPARRRGALRGGARRDARGPAAAQARVRRASSTPSVLGRALRRRRGGVPRGGGARLRARVMARVCVDPPGLLPARHARAARGPRARRRRPRGRPRSAFAGPGEPRRERRGPSRVLPPAAPLRADRGRASLRRRSTRLRATGRRARGRAARCTAAGTSCRSTRCRTRSCSPPPCRGCSARAWCSTSTSACPSSSGSSSASGRNIRRCGCVAAAEQASIRFADRVITCTEQMREAFVGTRRRPGQDRRSSSTPPTSAIFDADRHPPARRRRLHADLPRRDRAQLRPRHAGARGRAAARATSRGCGWRSTATGLTGPSSSGSPPQLGLNGSLLLQRRLGADRGAGRGDRRSRRRRRRMRRDAFRDLTHCNKMFDLIAMRTARDRLAHARGRGVLRRRLLRLLRVRGRARSGRRDHRAARRSRAARAARAPRVRRRRAVPLGGPARGLPAGEARDGRRADRVPSTPTCSRCSPPRRAGCAGRRP